MSSRGDSNAFQDPGWSRAVRRGLLHIPFGTLLLWARTPRGVDGLTALRIAFLSFAESLVLILVVLGIVAAGWESGPSRPGLSLLILLGSGF
jgi:hypothetical protein